METLKGIMNCIGVDTSGTVSVLGHMFGFLRSRVPADPCITGTAQVSLLQYIDEVKGDHIHLNIIRVGIDNFTDAEVDKIDYAIYRIREIYRPVNMGVGRVEHYNVTAAEADGTDDIGSEDEAEDLTHDWTVPNDAIDVFMVDNISAGFVGLSPVDGPCNKNDSDDMNGVLGGEVNRSSSRVARTFAHEVGHYLGLPHNHGDDDCPDTTAGRDNLMAQTGCANNICTSVNLSSSQGDDMDEHCFVLGGC